MVGGKEAYYALPKDVRKAYRKRAAESILTTDEVMARTADIVIPGLGANPQEDTFHEERKARYAESDNKQSRDPRGYVYVLTNMFRPGWSCVGCTTDPRSRLTSYLKADPERDMLRFEKVRYVPDRREAERHLHRTLERRQYLRKGEWFHAPASVVVHLLDEYTPRATT